MRFALRISSVFKPVFFAAGATHESSYVEIGEDHLYVKMGPWFDQTFPLDHVKSVGPSEWPWYGGLGVKVGPTKGAVGVVGSLEGVVVLTFDPPQHVELWAVVASVPAECHELRIALEEPAAFQKAIRDICHLGGAT